MANVNDLPARVAELSWHHSIDLGNGVVTPGGKSLDICNAEASLIFDRVNCVLRLFRIGSGNRLDNLGGLLLTRQLRY